MSDGARDPVAAAAARLEAAVERLATAVARPKPQLIAQPQHLVQPLQPAKDAEAVPRAEVAAMAERLDATIARLRAALAEDLRAPESNLGEPD